MQHNYKPDAACSSYSVTLPPPPPPRFTPRFLQESILALFSRPGNEARVHTSHFCYLTIKNNQQRPAFSQGNAADYCHCRNHKTRSQLEYSLYIHCSELQATQLASTFIVNIDSITVSMVHSTGITSCGHHGAAIQLLWLWSDDINTGCFAIQKCRCVAIVGFKPQGIYCLRPRAHPINSI